MNARLWGTFTGRDIGQWLVLAGWSLGAVALSFASLAGGAA